VIGLGAVSWPPIVFLARLPRAGALPLSDRFFRQHRDPAPAPHRQPGQRRPTWRCRSGAHPVPSPPSSPRSAIRHLSWASYLRDTRGSCSCRGARALPLGLTLAAAQALRPAARGVGPGDADAARDPATPRVLGDVLRRLPVAALRGHKSAGRSRSSGWCCSRSGRGTSAPTSGTSTPASKPGRTRSNPHLYDQVGGSYQIAQSAVSRQADGGMFGTGFGQSLLKPPRAAGRSSPRRTTDPHLRRHQRTSWAWWARPPWFSPTC